MNSVGDLTLETGPGRALKEDVPASYFERHWYAAYTCPRHEKRIAEQLQQRTIESFLPLYETVRRWKDRRVRLQLPLFPGYVFVRIALKNRLSVLGIPGVVRLVGFNGSPVALPQDEIETLRKGLTGRVCAQPHPYLRVGHRVRITTGPLQGLEGILLQRKRNLRVILSIDLLMRSIMADLGAWEVEPVVSLKVQ